MSFTTAEIKARIVRQITNFGLIDSNMQTDILTDALNEFISKMDMPIISDVIAVTTNTDKYLKPSTISKIQDIRDIEGLSVSYNEDLTTGYITLESIPTVSGNYTIYGTPSSAQASIDTIIGAIKDEYFSVLWAFIIWAAHEYNNEASATDKLQKALLLANNARFSINSRLDQNNKSIQCVDKSGKNITKNYLGSDFE
jgi:hypothetical protein